MNWKPVQKFTPSIHQNATHMVDAKPATAGTRAILRYNATPALNKALIRGLDQSGAAFKSTTLD
jgi:hypothetical protein